MKTFKTGTEVAALGASLKFAVGLSTIRRHLVKSCSLLRVAVTTPLIIAGVTFGDTPKEPLKPETIPIDTLWGFNIRDTKPIEQLKPDGKVRVKQIIDLLVERPKEGEKAGPAIVVEGKDRRALTNALIGRRWRAQYNIPPPNLMRENVDLSLFFYVYLGGRWVRIDRVEIENDQSITRITLKYHFVSHMTADSTVHFALIPLGKLSAGAVKVRIEQLPAITDVKGTEGKIRDETRIVCDSFAFGVQPRNRE
jgi:hypothetical protein